MPFLRNVIVLGLVSKVVLGQSSSSEQMFSIQTDAPTPTSSASSSASATPSGGLGSSMGGLFPEQCADDCSPVAQSLTDCGLGDLTGFDVSCLCNARVENAFLTCIECAGRADPNPSQAVGSYQSLIDAYLQQCAYASVTLSSATVDLSSTSAASSTSVSGSSSFASSSASASASASSSSAGSTSSSAPSSSSSVSTISQATSSASSVAASSTPSNTASRIADQGWVWGLTGVSGVVVAAALGL